MAEWLQFGAVLLVVAVAASYLALRAVSLFRGKHACGSGCSGCPKSTTAAGRQPLVQLEEASKPSPR